MARITNSITSVVSTDTTLNTSTLITLSTVVDTREALSGVIHVKFKCSTAPGTGKTLKFYLLYSKDGTTFDDSNVSLLTELASIALPNDTADHNISIPVDGVTFGAQYTKIACICDAASNYGMLRTLDVSGRKAV